MDSSKFCGRKLTENEVASWHELRQSLNLFDVAAAKSKLASRTFSLSPTRPRLLFDAADVETIRSRADESVRHRVRNACEALVATPPEDVDGRNPVYLARPAGTVADGFLVLGEERFADWSRRRIEALLKRSTWMGDVHRKLCERCDHVMANVAVALTRARDCLGDAVDDGFDERLGEGLRRLFFEPYLESAQRRDDFWSRDLYLANWKIMTHGDAGTAICDFADRWPESGEALGLAVDGVVEILDSIPPEGDWPEGIGYWYAVLFMGLRFALALRRLTDGGVDLFQHPRLDVTGNFGAQLVSPGGNVFNFGDNGESLAPTCAEALLILGVERDRPDWITAARQAPSESALWLRYDDSAIATTPAPSGAVRFSSAGVGVIRKNDIFIGMKSGDSTVGHAHLDANSIVVETRDTRLFRDEGNWPYAHFLGFFKRGEGYGGERWDFDGLATIGHNTILVDGRGQAYGKQYAGEILPPTSGDDWFVLEGDASKCYPDSLRKWRRAVALIGDNHLIIRDVITCEGRRHVEWLLHSDAELLDEGDDTLLVTDDGQARLTPLLPDRSSGWRIADVTRRSLYENSNTGAIERPLIRYRSFATLHSADRFEFLFLLRLDDSQVVSHEVEIDDGQWRITFDAMGLSAQPSGDSIIVKPAS